MHVLDGFLGQQATLLISSLALSFSEQTKRIAQVWSILLTTILIIVFNVM